ncbi:MAG: hypothetical protein Tsb0013_24310 [Phycisphaerales bacterium]
MLIPLGTDVRLRRPTLVTYVLMAVCVLAFVGQRFADARTADDEPRAYESLILYGFDPEGFDAPPVDAERDGASPAVVTMNPSRPWQFVTYQFLHGGWLHLIGNMVFLLVFGPPVEDRFGRAGFLAFYLLAGAMAGLAHGLLETRTTMQMGTLFRVTPPVIGASGSIAAVSGAYLVMFPKAPVRVFAFLFVFFGRFTLPGWVFVVMGVFFDLVYLGFGDRGVAHIAHLGGYLTGAGVAMFLLWRKIIDRQPFDLFSMARQAKRRREYKALVTKGPGASPFVKDAGVKATDAEDPHAGERRAIAALASTDPAGAADRYLRLSREDPKCVLARDAQLAVANVLYERGDATHAVEAYERFLTRYPDDREADQTRLLIAMLCARTLNDPVCALRHLDAIDDDALPEGLRELASTIREELG